MRFPIKLDKERNIEFTNGALYRMGGLRTPDGGFDFEDLGKPRKSYAALVAWVWACLVPEDQSAFPLPEDVLKFVPMEVGVIEKLRDALVAAINAGGTASKNANSSTGATSQSLS